MGIKRGARLRAFLAILSAFSGSDGLGPQDLDHKEFRAMWKEIAAIGRLIEARSWKRDGPADRQSGNPGPSGNPAERIALRSGGKPNPNSASARANSDSLKPGWTCTPEFFRWVSTLSAKEVKERRLLRGGRGVEGVEAEAAAAALAESRRRPATWAGFRPVILRSTSTIVSVYSKEGLYGRRRKRRRQKKKSNKRRRRRIRRKVNKK